MRGLAIRLGGLAVTLLLISQFAIPPFVENRAEDRLTEHGGTAAVDMSAIPALRLLFGHGDDLSLRAQGLSVDLEANQKDVFKQLDNFNNVTVAVSDSRAGPFTVRSFWIRGTGDHSYDVIIAGDGTAGDVARYAGSRLGGGFGQALAGLAAGALGSTDRPIPFNARMKVDTSGGSVSAQDVTGDVAGFPAGPLAQIVTNALLNAL
jgi:hypothetical protein